MAKTILIADDDPTIIKLLQVNLEMEGYDVVTAFDGQDAVEKAEAQPPDLVILDIMMPRMDGWAAREALADTPTLAEIPVIFLSARAQQADLRRGYEAGVAEYVTKPFDPTALLDIIQQVLEGTYERPPHGGGRA
jgi:two-component system alkaline phosphatase synthesis response regulator PhoP/two-component system response regulator VicR